jgi:1-phosphatidylinositol-4-phosphate 5-kinase
MPTTVLAARHMRRATSLIQPQREGRPSADDEPAGPHRISTSSGGAAAAAPPAASSSVAAAAGGEQGAAAAARHLGTGLPAVAVSQQAGQPAEEVLLFFGIIDFLQEYNMRKKLEHSIKAVVQDGKAISGAPHFC